MHIPACLPMYAQAPAGVYLPVHVCACPCVQVFACVPECTHVRVWLCVSAHLGVQLFVPWLCSPLSPAPEALLCGPLHRH